MTSLNPNPEDLTKASDAYLEQSLLSMQESVLRKTQEILIKIFYAFAVELPLERLVAREAGLSRNGGGNPSVVSVIAGEMLSCQLPNSGQ